MSAQADREKSSGTNFDPALLAEAVSIVHAKVEQEALEREGVSPKFRKWRCIASGPIFLPDLESRFTKEKRLSRRGCSNPYPYALAYPAEAIEQRVGDRDDVLVRHPNEWREITEPEEFANTVTVEEQVTLKAAFDAPVTVAENKARAATTDVRANESLVAELVAAGERLQAVEKEAAESLEIARARREEFLESKSPAWREALLAAVSYDRTRPRELVVPGPARAIFAPRAPGEGKRYTLNSAGQREEM